MNIYVAGPFTENPSTWTEICAGIGYTLMKMGVNAIVPHMMTGAWDGTDLHYEDYMRLDLNVIENWADAVFLVAESPGANREVALAERLGKPVLRSWRDFYEWYHSNPCRLVGAGYTTTLAPSQGCTQEREDVDVHSSGTNQRVEGFRPFDSCPTCGDSLRLSLSNPALVLCPSCSHHYARFRQSNQACNGCSQ